MRMRSLLGWLRGAPLFEMANVSPRRTGLPYGIWISHGGGGRHGPRIKAFPEGARVARSQIVVTVEEAPRVVQCPRTPHIQADHLRQLVAFVQINRAVLQAYWDDADMDTQDMLEQLRAI